MPKKGDRVRLLRQIDDKYPGPIPAGTKGTVDYVHQVDRQGTYFQVSVLWDNGRKLMLLPSEDHFEVLS